MKANLWQKYIITSNNGIRNSPVSQNSYVVLTQKQCAPIYIQSLSMNRISQSSFHGNLSQQPSFNTSHIPILQQYLPINYNTHTLLYRHNIPSTFLLTRSLNMNYHRQTQLINTNVSFMQKIKLLKNRHILLAFNFSISLLVYTINDGFIFINGKLGLVRHIQERICFFICSFCL